MVASNKACSKLLTQARNIQVMTFPSPTTCRCSQSPAVRVAHTICRCSQPPGTLQACAPVQVLYANVIRLDSFGRALGIKHLMLRATNICCSRLSPTLSVLGQLQTLWLAKDAQQQQESGALHLTALQDLWSVVLNRTVPESIQVNDSCELHVVQYTQWEPEHSVCGHDRAPSALIQAGCVLSGGRVYDDKTARHSAQGKQTHR